MNKFKKIVSIVASVIVLLLIIFKALIYIGGNENRTINNYFAAIQKNDLSKAYSYTSQEFRGVTSLDDFKAFVDNHPVLYTNAQINISKEETIDKIHVVYITLKADKHEDQQVLLQLVKNKGHWEINYIELLTKGLDKNAPSFNSKTLNEPMTVNADQLSQTYDDKNARYSIHYPTNWEYTMPDHATIVFSGKKDTPDYYSTVNIQVVNASEQDKSLSVKDAVNLFTEDLKKQFNDGNFTDQKPFFIYTSSGEQLTGQSFNVSYTYKGDQFQQWQLVVYRPKEGIFYAFGYTAPPQIYKTYLPIAQAMLKTWVLY